MRRTDGMKKSEHSRGGGHKTIVCTCGIVLSTCRCYSPGKQRLVSTKPCTHKTKPGLIPALAENKTAYIQPTLVGFEE